ncbi:UNVERIFIED_CONTAM: Nucleoporin p58/p45 [Siphonaria sp. JEL0065]|nr:Nucleoporin p58/p45 [Siphonaria sp. JEL0065]
MFSFGAAPAGTTATPGTSSLFGQQQQPQPAGSLFGAAPTPAATSAATAGGFGGGGLFGSTPAAATPATGGLFGQPPVTTTTAPATTGGGLFGAAATATPGAAQPTTGGFGLFGSATPAAAPTTNSSSLFGVSTAANTAANAGATAPVEKTTRYGELPQNIKSELDAFETFVQKQIEMAEEIAASGFTKRINATREEFKNIELKYQGLKSLLDRDNALIQNLRGMVGKEMKTADFATRFVDSYQTHRQASMQFNNTDSFQYFVNLTNTLESRLQSYRQTIDDLERHLQSVSQITQHSPQAIAEILKQQHESFLVIAGKIAAAHDALGKQRDAFLAYRKKYFGDNKNPFRKGYVGQDDRISLSTIAAGLKPSDLNASVGGGAAGAPTAGGSLFGTSQPAAATGGFGFGTAATPGAGLFATPNVKKKGRI